MAYGNYATWQDVKAYLDTDVYSDGEEGSESGPVPANPEALQALLDVEAPAFERRVAGTVKVPIDEDESPDTFQLARTIVATRVAAGYAKTLSQAEGTVVESWFYDWLEKKGAEALGMMLVPHQAPADAEDSAHPTEYLPRAGLVEGTSATPMFGAAHITGGSNPW